MPVLAYAEKTGKKVNYLENEKYETSIHTHGEFHGFHHPTYDPYKQPLRGYQSLAGIP